MKKLKQMLHILLAAHIDYRKPISSLQTRKQNPDFKIY